MWNEAGQVSKFPWQGGYGRYSFTVVVAIIRSESP